ncbi:MAG: hypothetical protein HQ503_05505 [Rhodospirillales bacterium]|nr:hypothetical protein [Rhodospirillales bacterium]
MSDHDDIIDHLTTEIRALETRLDSNNDLIVALRNQLDAHQAHRGDDRRTQIYRRAATDIVPGEALPGFSNRAPVLAKDLGEALVALGARLDHKFAEIKALSEITEGVNAGMFFDEVLDHVFESFGQLMPYDRIGVALIEKSKSDQDLVRARWSRAKYAPIYVGEGYAAILENSNLGEIARMREPRILNNLGEYLAQHRTRLRPSS